MVLTLGRNSSNPSKNAQRGRWRSFLVDITIWKNLVAKYWWPMPHKDVMDHCKSCDNWKQTRNLVHTNITKLITMLFVEPFTKWGTDFISPIKSIGHYTSNHYVLVLTHPPNSLKDSNASLKVKIMKGVGVCSLAHNILEVRGACWSSAMGTKTSDKRVNYSYGLA